jgi:regulator of RNase E activity RraA
MNQDFSMVLTPDYGNVLSRDHFIDFSIHPLWNGMPSISGEAFTVQLAAGDHLMLHSAIYEAPAGCILVVDGVDCSAAVAGGNVCAIAKKRGIKGFIIDGVIRDIIEIEEMQFPVYAKGVFPVPGKKEQYSELCKPIICGGVKISTGDIIVADREGIVVIPKSDKQSVFSTALEKAQAEAQLTLAEWEANHRKKIEQALVKAKK